VTGSIAAYKAVEVLRRLVDAGIHVTPVLTEDALRFVGAATFSALASAPVRISLFDDSDPIPHTRLAREADVVVVAPATAKLLGKYAAGISDDLLTATLLATRAPVLVAPAMHAEMWEHPAVRDNMTTLRDRGVHVVNPVSGHLAGGDRGVGRLVDPESIIHATLDLLGESRGLFRGVGVLVTAGGTREAIDPVRYIGNRSSGKMGHCLAAAARRRGARVTVITTSPETAPAGVEIVRVESSDDMREATLARAPDAMVVVMAAAVADFRPKVVAIHKIKKTEGVPEIILEPTPDILAALGVSKHPGQVLVGFAAETDDLVARARAKLGAKKVDLMVANDVSDPEAGFEVDTNRATLLDAFGRTDEMPLMTKEALAALLLDRIEQIMMDHGETISGVVEHEPGESS